jgi:1-acyl-sn-glycerol-3-phosphate acyltransferase
LKTIPVVVLLFVVVSVLMPVLVVMAAAVDAWRWTRRRRHWMGIRLTAFLWVYLSAQVGGLVWMLLSWLSSGLGRSHDRLVRSTYRIQGLWARYLFRAVRVVFGLSLEVEGEEAITPGRVVFMARHASLIDTLLPSVLITTRHGIRLRYVLKKELLVDPALDVAGNRLPNFFVDRGARRSGGELAGIAALGGDLGEHEGVLIYPEGTRFRPQRQERAIARLAGSAELHEIARGLRNVHPPRPGGALALIDAGCDVVFVAHSGLDGFASVRDIWRGSLVGRSIAVRFWRVPSTEIPRGRGERTVWLFHQWKQVDAAVAELVATSRAG